MFVAGIEILFGFVAGVLILFMGIRLVIWFLVGTMNTALGVERVLDKIVATLARHKKMCIAICFSGVGGVLYSMYILIAGDLRDVQLAVVFFIAGGIVAAYSAALVRIHPPDRPR